jgi:hypothetical protein
MIFFYRFPVVVWLAPTIILASASFAATKSHVIAFGNWTTVQWIPGPVNDKPLPMKVRPLLVDGRIKEHTFGLPHEVTERLFVIRRAFRVNDSLPEESSAPRWQWQRGGWLLVDRVTARISPIALPDFDAFYSAASWYRDYVAYCGVSDDGKKVYAVVAQISRRKPVLKKTLAGESIPDDAPADSACAAPTWQRIPARVTFEPAAGTKQAFAIRGHMVDFVADDEEDEEASK